MKSENDMTDEELEAHEKQTEVKEDMFDELDKLRKLLNSSRIEQMYVIKRSTTLGPQCQPKGTMVHTTRGKVDISDLDEKKDRLITYCSNHNYFRFGTKDPRAGRTFTKQERFFKGDLLQISTKTNSHLCTPDHLSIVRWSENAYEKYVVYLMKKGQNWRIGKSFLLKEHGNKIIKTKVGPMSRTKTEQADAFWILGVFDSNAQALLAEEFFSIKFGITKTLFMATGDRDRKKTDGLLRWVTQEELDVFQNKVRPTQSQLTSLFNHCDLDQNIPFWSAGNRLLNRTLGTKFNFIINSANILPEFMDVFIFNESREPEQQQVISKAKIPYEGQVYSLDVVYDKNYIADGILTHNCPYYLKAKRLFREQEEKQILSLLEQLARDFNNE